MDDLRLNGAGVGTNPDGTAPSKQAAWLNGVYLSDAAEVSISGVYVYGPQQSASGPGITILNGNAYVTGAGILLDANRYDSGAMSQQINVSGLFVKGYVAGFAAGGVYQSASLSNSFCYVDDWCTILGGGSILDQAAGSPVTSQATTIPISGTQIMPYSFTMPQGDAAKVTVGEHFVLQDAGAIPFYPYVAAITTSGSLSTILWTSRYTDNTGASNNDTCTFTWGSPTTTVKVGCSVAQGSQTNGVTLNGTPSTQLPAGANATDSLGLLPTAPYYALRVFPNAGTQGAGTFIPYGGNTAWTNFNYMTTGVVFTKGLILNTPFATGTFTMSNDYADDYDGLIENAPDPGTAAPVGNYSSANVIVSNNNGQSSSGSASAVWIDIGSACQSEVVNNVDAHGPSSSNTQSFIKRTGNQNCGGPGVSISGNQMNVQNSTAPVVTYIGQGSGDEISNNLIPAGLAFLPSAGTPGAVVGSNSVGGAWQVGPSGPGSTADSGSTWSSPVYGTITAGATALLTPAGALSSGSSHLPQQNLLNGVAIGSGSLELHHLSCQTADGNLRFGGDFGEGYNANMPATAWQAVKFAAPSGTNITGTEASGASAGQGTNQLTVTFSQSSFSIGPGQVVTDTTNPSAIPAGTVVQSVANTSSAVQVIISKLASAAVSAGDTLNFTTPTLPPGVSVTFGASGGLPTVSVTNPSTSSALACTGQAAASLD